MTDRVISVFEKDGRTYILHEDSTRRVDLFVEGVQGVQVVNSFVRLNFFTRRFDAATNKENEEHRDVTCRMAIDVDTFMDVVSVLQEIATEIRKAMATPKIGG